MTHLSIGERIRALRTEQGLTQKQLGERCGMSDAEIRKFESDRGSPTVRSLQRIANALGSSVAFLVDEHGASRETTTGQRIRMARERAGMKQRDLADKLGVSYVNVSQWERDTRNPKYSTLQKISDAVGISVTFLLGLESAADENIVSDMRGEGVANMDTPVKFTIHAAGWDLDTVLNVIERIKARYPDAEISIEM